MANIHSHDQADTVLLQYFLKAFYSFFVHLENQVDKTKYDPS